MTKLLTFLHTSPVHIKTFDALLHEMNADIDVEHIVDEALLDDARQNGITQNLQARVSQTVLEAVNRGASVVLCTCSTIGGCAEAVNTQMESVVMRVDRAMAAEAVAIGNRIIVAATLASTLIPTKELILDEARRADKTISLVDVVCELAWAKFEEGDQDGYLQSIANELQENVSKGDVIVLAQASMAQATGLCPDLSIPVLSSPRLGLEAILKAMHI